VPGFIPDFSRQLLGSNRGKDSSQKT